MLYQCIQTLLHYAPYDYDILVVEGDEENEGQDRVDRVVDKCSEAIGVLHLGENRKAMGAFNAGLKERISRPQTTLSWRSG